MIHDVTEPNERDRLGTYLDELDAEFGSVSEALIEYVAELWPPSTAA